jgi:prepilin-type N-terminal cleavage/methylation domain-containing protein
MKTKSMILARRTPAFTLMELLVVIAIIAILAALLFPAGAAIKNKATIKKAQSELSQVVAMIERYKTRFGYYPPDHPTATGVDPLHNSLYFELVGSTHYQSTNTYMSLDGAAWVKTNDCPAVFGVGISSILNATKSTEEESKPAEKFLLQLKPNQYYQYTTGSSTIRLLTCSVTWPENLGTVIGVPLVNPWRYLKNGTNNPGSFDLWVDIFVSGKTNRISNWSSTPQYVY